MKILVTGSTGFFGRGIVSRLRKAGHEVVGAARTLTDNATVCLDVTSRESCRKALAENGVDSVVHAAALAHARPGQHRKELYYLVNVEGTKNMIEAAVESGVKHFVLTSSVTVYGDFDLPRRVTEEYPTRAFSIYGLTKRMAEEISLPNKEEISLHILRMATMYSADWLFNIRKRIAPPIVGTFCYLILDPLSRRYSLCSRGNGAEAVLWAVEQRIPADIYNVADHYEYCQEEIARAIEKIEGEKLHLVVPPILPLMMWRVLKRVVPVPRWRSRLYTGYWKFCKDNLYSTEKLGGFGLEAPPDLLEVGKTHCSSVN